LFIKVAIDDGVPPAFLAWVRVVLGGIVLLALAWSAGVLAGLRGRWRWLAVFAVIEIAIPFALIAAGEQHVASSLRRSSSRRRRCSSRCSRCASTTTSASPARGVAGLLLGLAGVVALVGLDATGSSEELLGAGRRPAVGVLLCRRADDPQAPARGPRPPRLDGAARSRSRPAC
jgi:hypothetical protein